MNNYSEETLNHFDQVVNTMIHDIFVKTNKDKEIVLKRVNRKNPEHLLVLRLSLLARDIFNMPLYIEGTWLQVLLINLKFHKHFVRIGRVKEAGYSRGFSVPALLNEERAKICKTAEDNLIFKQIYQAYYERTKND